MDLGLTTEQELIKKSFRDFLNEECPKSLVRKVAEGGRGYNLALWNRIASLGWMGLPFPEKYGGHNGSFLDLVVLLEEIGRACMPGPFFSTVVEGGLICLEAGNETQKQFLLPQLVKGKIVLSMALLEQDSGYTPLSIKMPAVQKKNEFVMNGTKLFVQNANIADFLICVVRTEDSLRDYEAGITLFLLDAKSPGIHFTPLNTFPGDTQYEVEFDNVRVNLQNMLGELGCGWNYLTKILRKAAIAKCAEILGALQQVQEMTVAYAKERVQFDQPIGSFQAVQHHCANMAIDLDSSRLITYQAASLLAKGFPSVKEVAMAKAWLSEACERVISLAHQIHGGVALIDDHDLTLYTHRVVGWSETYGNADFHREVIAKELGI